MYDLLLRRNMWIEIQDTTSIYPTYHFSISAKVWNAAPKLVPVSDLVPALETNTKAQCPDTTRLAKKVFQPSIHRIHHHFYHLLSLHFPLFHLLTENTPGRPDATPCRSHTHRKVNEWQTTLSCHSLSGYTAQIVKANALHAKPNGRSLVSRFLPAPRVLL